MSNEFTKPAIGMGCTVGIGSDSYAYTVTAVFETNRGYDVQVQQDRAVPAEGHDYYGTQKYSYERNHKGDVKLFRWERSADARWREIVKKANGRFVFAKPDCYRLAVGERGAHSDPSF